MPLATLERVFKRTGEFLRARPQERIEFIWHGGEPLLLGADYLNQAADFQRKHCDGVENRLTHHMQSNLTLLSDSFFPAFRGLGITTLGTSYDPQPAVRGAVNGTRSEDYTREFFSRPSPSRKTWSRLGHYLCGNKTFTRKPGRYFYPPRQSSGAGRISYESGADVRLGQAERRDHTA